jgi:hypothetical protein
MLCTARMILHTGSLLPSSIQKKGHLICKPHTDDQLTALKCGHPSSHERFVYDLLDSTLLLLVRALGLRLQFHKITGQRLCQKACRVDIVFSMACRYRAAMLGLLLS